MNYKKTLGFALLLSLLSTSSFAKGVGASTDLKAWRVTDHSAKIAFRDNTQDEDEFWIDIMNEYGEIVKRKKINASSGTGKMRIAKIGKLKSGHNYMACVSAYIYKDDYIPVKINSSKLLKFRTKGQHEDSNGIIKEAKMWNIKKTSAVISFNSPPLGYQRLVNIINDDTDTLMKLNSKGIVPVPNKNPNKNYHAAKLINLEPGTTYTIKLIYISFEMEYIPTYITFTTKE